MKFFATNDEEVFKKVSAIFTPDIQVNLHEFDFANTGHMHLITPLFEFYYYMKTSDFEFIQMDEEFSEIYSDLKTSLESFVNVFSRNTIPTGNDMSFVAPSNEWDGPDYAQLRQEANEINDAAEDLHDKIRNFLKEGKKRIDMSDKSSSQNTINVHGGVVNASIGDGNTMTNYVENEYDQKLNVLIKEISESSLDDRQDIIEQINDAKSKGDKAGVMKVLGDLLTRGAEAASFVASIGSILAL